MGKLFLFLATFLWLGQASAAEPYADRMVVFNCGEAHAEDQGRWSPGVNVGKGFDMSDNCYLIRHGDQWLLWDTGIDDRIADLPAGERNSFTGTTWRRRGKLVDQLAAIGVQPDAIRWLAISHSHPDHSGNVERFPRATLLVQAAEYNWPQADHTPRFAPSHPVHQLHGDYDVFGDASVQVLATPGHTPGHQSLMVRLRHTGTVILSGDVVHFEDNWANRRVPVANSDAAASRASMDKVASALAHEHGSLWINHDLAQSRTQKHAPSSYD